MRTLEESIGRVSSAIEDLGQDKELTELLRIIHRPGWTTPAELRLVNGLVELMETQVKMVVATRGYLLQGAREVGTAQVGER